jgi:hypothetical protein
MPLPSRWPGTSDTALHSTDLSMITAKISQQEGLSVPIAHRQDTQLGRTYTKLLHLNLVDSM